MTARNFFFWLLVVLVAALVMQPAHADGVVAPVSGGPIWRTNSVTSTEKLTALESCVAYTVSTVSINDQGYDLIEKGTVFPFGLTNSTNPLRNYFECYILNVGNGIVSKFYTYPYDLPVTCPANATASGMTCTCDAHYKPNVSATACVVDAVCPRIDASGDEMDRGYHFKRLPAGISGDSPMADACDPFSNCAVNVNVVTHLFGVALIHTVPTDQLCQAGAPQSPITLTVTLSPAPPEPDNTRFNDVVTKAALVNPTKTATAKAEAAAGVAEVGQRISIVESSLTAAQQALLDKQAKVQALQRAASDFIAAPNTDTLARYNAAMQEVKTFNASYKQLISKAKSDWSVATTSLAGLQAKADSSDATRQEISRLQDSIIASGHNFDQTLVDAQKGDSTGLDASTTALISALTGAVERMSTAKTGADTVTTNNTSTDNTVNNTHNTITNIYNTYNINNNWPPLEPPPDTTPETPPTPPIDCRVTPGAPGCIPVVDCTATPNAPGCKTPCEVDPEAVGCAHLGEVADDVPLGEKTINVSAISPVSVGNAGACPAPAPMILHGQTYYFEYDIYCNYARGIKPILLVFAWLAVAGILVGGFKT